MIDLVDVEYDSAKNSATHIDSISENVSEEQDSGSEDEKRPKKSRKQRRKKKLTAPIVNLVKQRSTPEAQVDP